jgi:hypothetical protein
MRKIRNFGATVACIALTSLTMGNAAIYAAEPDPVSNERPYLRTNGERVLVSFLNQNMEQVKLKVIDETGRMLYREVIKDEFVIQKSFNFENAFEGTYRIIIISSGEKFVKKIRIS